MRQGYAKLQDVSHCYESYYESLLSIIIMTHYYESADIGGVRMLVFHHRKPQNGDRYRFRPMIALVALLPSRAEQFYNIFQDTFQTKIITGCTSGPFLNKSD